MKSIEISAKTIEEAIAKGLEELGASLSDVEIDILDEGSKGLFGLIGGKPARVRMTLKESKEEPSIISSLSLDNDAPKKDDVKTKAEAAKQQAREKAKKPAKPDTSAPAAPANLPKKEKTTPATGAPVQPKATAEKPAQPKAAPAKTSDEPAVKVETVLCENPDSPEGKAQRFLLDVTKLMDVDVSVNVKTDDEGNVRVDMRGDTLGILIGRRGETLDSLQYLTSLYVNRGKDDYTRVTLDTENYRAKREEALTRLANRMANRAVKTGRKVVLEPMNPYERRILHSALQSSDSVTTHSEGDEPNRHVVITLK